MHNIAEILAWKFEKAPGIRTVGDQITEWPQVLGPIPTQAQLDQWTAEYEAFRTAEEQKVAAQKEKEERARLELAALRAEQAGQEDRLNVKDILVRVKKIEEILGLDNQ